MSIKDGGPAFPHKRISHMTAVPVDDYPFAPSRAEPVYEDATGMSLRDWFAGQALVGICSHSDTWGLLDKEIVKKSFELAGAMLAERAKQESADD